MARRRIQRLVGKAARASGLQVAPASYHSPLVDPGELSGELWERRFPLHGIELDAESQIAWAERELAEHVGGLSADFPLDNDYYEQGDAELAYAFVRRFRPERVVELGSGYSTRVLAQACSEVAGCQLEVNDPYPGEVPVGRVQRRRAQDIPPEELASADLLFVDTSHVVKLGGDVNFVILEVLPQLRPGALAHFHDIWLPYEYHRALFEELGMHWNEQYLLQAFLTGNDGWEVLFATHAVAREQPERLRALIPSYTGDNWPSSFWLRRR